MKYVLHASNRRGRIVYSQSYIIHVITCSSLKYFFFFQFLYNDLIKIYANAYNAFFVSHISHCWHCNFLNYNYVLSDKQLLGNSFFFHYNQNILSAVLLHTFNNVTTEIICSSRVRYNVYYLIILHSQYCKILLLKYTFQEKKN